MKTKKVYKRSRKAYKKRRSVKKDIAVIKKQLRARRPETKHVDSTVIAAGVDNNPTFNIRPYTAIGQGTGDYAERIGDQIKAKFFNCRIQFYKASTIDSRPRRIRLGAFIYKKNPDNAVFSFSTIINLYLASTSMNGTNAPMAFRDWDNHSSFHTLYDKLYVLNQNSSVEKLLAADFTIRIPTAYQAVQFVAAGTGNVCQNELIVFAIQSEDAGVAVDYQWRLSYTDP